MGVVIIHWWIFHQINHPYLYICIVGNLPHIYSYHRCGSNLLDQGCSACFEHRASEGWVAGFWAKTPTRLGLATAPKMMRGLLRTYMKHEKQQQMWDDDIWIYMMQSIRIVRFMSPKIQASTIIWGTPRYFRWSSWIGSKRLRSNYQVWLRYVGSRVEV